MQATLTRLENLFDTDYAINRGRPEGRGPALGRYHGDVYYPGSAYYFSTLRAAEFCYSAEQPRIDAHACGARADPCLEPVRASTLASRNFLEHFAPHARRQLHPRHLQGTTPQFIRCAMRKHH